MDELGRINQQDDFEDLMSNIERESQAGQNMSQSPSIASKAKTKNGRNYDLNTVDLDGKANIFGNKNPESKDVVNASDNQTIVNNSVRQTTELGIDDLM